MTGLRPAARAGIRDLAPLVPGVLPFAMIAGFAGVDAGLPAFQSIAMSWIVFAGAAQLAALDLIARDGAFVVIVLTALVINARFLMYSASLAPYLREVGVRPKLGAAYLLTDQAFAVSVVRFAARDDGPADRLAYFLGGAMTMWVTWQVGTVVGALAGTGIPPEWSLDFAVPLVFVALVVPAIRTRPDGAAALVAAVVAVTAAGLPWNTGLLAGAGAGIVAGLAAGRRP